MTNFGLRSQRDEAFSALYQEQEGAVRGAHPERRASSPPNYGDLGNVYGKQWRRWETSQGETIDQLQNVIEEIKRNPDSQAADRHGLVAGRRDAARSALPPCHTLFQFYVADNKLSCQLYQRSGDIFLGIPFNIASYALLTHMIAQECGLDGRRIRAYDRGRAYLFEPLDQIETQLGREPKPLPTLKLNPDVSSVFDFDVGRHSSRRLRAASFHQSARRGISIEVQRTAERSVTAR